MSRLVSKGTYMGTDLYGYGPSKVPRPKNVIYTQVEHDSFEQWVNKPICHYVTNQLC